MIAAQGLWLRRRAPRFAEAAGPRSGTVGSGAPLRLLALGDSIIAGVGLRHSAEALPTQFATTLAAAGTRTVHWQALGCTGANAADSLQRLHQQRDGLAGLDLLLLSTGVNDVTGLRPRRAFARDLHGVAELLASTAPRCRLLLAAVPPLQAFPLLPDPLRRLLGLRSRQLDAVMAGIANGWTGALHVPMPFLPEPRRFGSDGFHPDAASCAEWAQWLAQHSLQRWPELGNREQLEAGSAQRLNAR